MTALQTRQDEPKFLTMLDSAAERIKAVLPPDVQPERFIKTVTSAYNRTPELRECTPASVLQSLIRSAEIGLTPNTALGHAYLVPFGNKRKVDGREVWVKECQLVIGYKGFIHLACRSGFFAAVDAREVRASDKFDLHYDPRPRVRHEPYLSGGPGGPVLHVYAYGVTQSGELVFELMDRDEVERVRGLSKSKDSPAWRNHWGEMAKKTVLKRLIKDQPCGDRVSLALETEADAETTGKPSVFAGGPSRSESLAAQLEAPSHRDEPSESDDEPSGDYPEPGSDG